MTLTRTIIGLASAFGLLTVAEGVETAEQFKLLPLVNCDQSQAIFTARRCRCRKSLSYWRRISSVEQLSR